MTGLPFRDAQTLLTPVDVVQGERSDFAGTQAVRHQQEQHGIIPAPFHHGAIDRVQQ